jgi:hypothetical protein
MKDDDGQVTSVGEFQTRPVFELPLNPADVCRPGHPEISCCSEPLYWTGPLRASRSRTGAL